MKNLNTALTKEMQRVQDKAASDTNFVTRNFPLKIVLFWTLYPVAAVWSAFTEGSHLFHHFLNTTNNESVSWIITIIIVIALELGKFFFSKSALDDIDEGVFGEDIFHQLSFVMKVVGAVGCFWFSISLSIQGAPVVAEDWKESTSPIALVSADSVNAIYDARIEKQELIIADARNMTWKGRITRNGQAVIKQAQAEISEIEDDRRAALSATDQENLDRKTEYNDEIADSGVWFTRFTGIGEALAILCMLFAGNYEAGARRNIASPTPHRSPGTQSSGRGIGFQQGLASNQNQQPPTSNQVPDELPHPTPRRPIGFFHPAGQGDPQPMERLQPVATKEEPMLEADAYRGALKDARKNYDAWKAKEENGRGTTETNTANMQKWAAKMSYYEKKLKELRATA